MTTNRSHTVGVTNDTRYGPDAADADRAVTPRWGIDAGQRLVGGGWRHAGAGRSSRAGTPAGVTRKVGTAMAFTEAGPASRFHETPSREIAWRFCVGADVEGLNDYQRQCREV